MTDQASTIFADKVNETQSSETVNKTISDQDKKTTTPVDVNSMFANQLSAITNEEGKPKYSTVEDALKALKHSQEHIRTLEVENSTLKDTSKRVTTTEELLELLNSKNDKTDDNQSKISIESIKEIVNNTLTETEKKKIANTNASTVRDALIKKYGDKAQEEYLNKAKALGLSVSMMDSLASTSPTAVLEYFQLKKDGVFSKNNQSSVNTETFNRTSQKSAPPSVMYGASSDKIKEAWNHAVQSVGN